LRVANVIEEGKLGGPQIRICMVAKALNGRVDTTVIMPLENSKHFAESCRAGNVSYCVVPLTRITREWRVAINYLIFSVLEVLRLAQILKKGGFDLVHVSGGAWQFKGIIAAKLAGIRVIWHLNDTSMPRFVRILFSLLSPLANAFIFASERSRCYYQPLIRKNITSFVIPAPVDTKAFDPTLNYFMNLKVVSQWANKLIVGTVCNVSPVKGLETFIRAAAVLNGQFDNVIYVVAGPIFKNQNRYFSTLLKLCADLGLSTIQFIGEINDVRTVISRFDVYVCSSLAESSPLAVWEAMSMGKPVVSTDVGDVALYVHSGQNGFIVDVADSGALARQIAVLLDDSSLRTQFGDYGREIAIKRLDLAHCVNNHFSAYSEVLSNRRVSN